MVCAATPAMSFLLIDRILEFEPAQRARASLAIPPRHPGLPPCLLVEAVGQLAGYLAMAEAGFSSRPVAAVADDVLVHAGATAGDELELEVEVLALRSSAIAYRGAARLRGAPLVEIRRALGALLPMAGFDEPERVRAELARLRDRGLDARTLPGPASLVAPTRVLERTPTTVSAEIQAPLESEVYAEHFPRRPVYPATLLLDAQIAVARTLAGALLGSSAPRLDRVRKVRVRSFTAPGDRLRLSSSIRDEAPGDRARIALEARAGATLVSSAFAEFRPS